MRGSASDIGLLELEDEVSDSEIERIEMYETRRARQRRTVRAAGVYAVTVGMADLAYGGPEEGGWYFDTFEPIRTFIVPRSRRRSLEDKLGAWLVKANEGRPEISSVLSEGRYWLRSGIITQPEPRVRPHYE